MSDELLTNSGTDSATDSATSVATSLASDSATVMGGAGVGGVGGGADDADASAGLTQQVDALLSDIEAAQDEVGKAMADKPRDAGVDLDAVRAEAVAAMRSRGADAGEAAPQPNPSVIEPTDGTTAQEPAAVDAILADARTQLGGVAPSAAPVPTSVTALDEQVAQAVDKLIANEPEHVTPAPVPPRGAEVPSPSPAPQPEAAAQATTTQPAPAPLASAVVASAVVATAAAAAVATGSASASSDAASSPSRGAAAAQRAKDAVATSSMRAVGALEGPLMDAAAVVNKPLANRPPWVRDTVGWIAAQAAFFAVVLWAWAMFWRAPAVSDAANVPFDFATGGLPRAEFREHGPAAAGPGAAASGAEGEAKADAEGDKGGGKGDEKKPTGGVLNAATRKGVVDQALLAREKAAAEKAKQAGAGGASGGH